MMLSPKVKKEILAKNKTITDAIKISQLLEHKGFDVLNKYIEEKRVNCTTPNIHELTTANDKNVLKNVYKKLGVSEFIFELISWLEDQDKLALEPMADPETGKQEKLNEKKKSS